jgi:hypothetical protein
VTGEVSIQIVVTHNVQAQPHEMEGMFMVSQDSPSSAPYQRSIESAVLALRKWADELDEMSSGPPITGSVSHA